MVRDKGVGYWADVIWYKASSNLYWLSPLVWIGTLSAMIFCLFFKVLLGYVFLCPALIANVKDQFKAIGYGTGATSKA
jgi:hypothetical protein